MRESILANQNEDMEALHKEGLLGKDEAKRKQVMKGFLYFYYPNRPNMVINALLAGLHTRDDNLVIRSTFDFMISHIEIESDFIEKEERVRLVEGALLTLMIIDFASHKKFFSWFLTHLEEMEGNVNREEPAIEACIEAYKRILKRYKNHSQKKRGLMAKNDDQNEQEINIKQPIQILKTVFKDDDMHDIVSLILTDITESLIKYIFHFYQDPRVDPQQLQKLK